MNNSTRLVCSLTMMAIFTGLTPAYSAEYPGKSTYDKSCMSCHGDAGRGSAPQDRFWNMRIPRLNGAYVQTKSDDQLRTVILNGTRKMPPALMGYPHTSKRTKVKSEDLPELIAYIRSLKSK